MTAMTTESETGLLTRRGALALAMAIAAGGQIRSAATAQSSPGVWTDAGNPARTWVFPGPGLDLTQEVTERWRIDDRFVQPCGVCDGIAYYTPIPYDPGDPFGQLVAVDALTGNELWQHEPPVTNPESSFWGDVAIADGLLVVSAGTLLVGLDAKTGEERWVFDLQGRSNWPSPAIVDGVLYISDTTSVNAITLGNTPEWLWKTSLGNGETSVVSDTVSVDGDYVIVTSRRPADGADSELEAIDLHVLNRADGNVLYQQQLQAGGGAHRVAVQNGMLFGLASMEAREKDFFFALSIDGTEQWRLELPDREVTVFASPAVTGELVICSAGDRLLGLNAATGEVEWSSPRLEPLSHPVVIDDVVYIGADALESTETIYAISAKDGSLLTSIPTGSSRSHVVGVTNGVLITSLGTRGLMTAFANPSGRA